MSEKDQQAAWEEALPAKLRNGSVEIITSDGKTVGQAQADLPPARDAEPDPDDDPGHVPTPLGEILRGLLGG